VIVIDCSYMLAMVMPDEKHPASMQEAAAGRLLVPSIWAYEVANALRNGMRRQRVTDNQVFAVCTRIEGLRIEVAGGAESGVRQRFIAAQNHELTAYDAAYIDLALRLHCALATLDTALAEVARRVGLRVID
jgi:predicted nucleic acid-binding protein